MKKIEKAKKFLQENLDLFQCPICQESFHTVDGNSLICLGGHNFNISKKGTIHFLTKGVSNEYNTEMLSARFRIAKAGLFDHMLDEIMTHIEEKNGTTIDIGSGEGSQLDYLSSLGLEGKKIGFDISKDAIALAGSHFTDAFWCVADLAHSPFASERYDTLLNIFSPSNYHEFKRMLKPNGTLLKIAPDKDYLVELRNLLYRDREEKQSYSNDVVVAKFQEHFPDSHRYTIRYTFPLTLENYQDLLEMTPLSWGASEEAKEYALAHPLKEITIHVCLLVGKM
ncbi:methyltransferase domain-containing protein [Desemzia sp. RIT804]|uniref:methyltransferase domain-containing protein n=1 Tax=Desemzia sp. RIT 804 TaxID=2810209 RepID=UPI00194FC6D7|nr:methyltransferase domain-containing protein [Desemzia sp. RIT 804]MBM6614248.1 methyltransferase domain-containing protein [Desemzia sp. RIT 804]